MGKISLEKSLPELRKQVESAAAKILEYKKKEKSLEDSRNRIAERLEALVKRIGEFSGGK